tara:strand:- start:1648 stop:1980 length:333 start_codon:yes stop_codon:yes gene_type:complete
MGKGPKAAPNEIATSCGDTIFRYEVGENLEDMRQHFRDDIIYHNAKSGMHSQAQQALSARLKQERSMDDWAPNAGRQPINPLVKAIADLNREEAVKQLEAALALAKNGSV